MAQLGADALIRARGFVMSTARPIDRALWRFHFENGPAADVWAELRRYRNDDGGFGNALEPDMRAPESSVLATTYALDVAAQLDDSSHDLVSDAVAYLVRVFDERRDVWRFLPHDLGPAPHAPWWDQGKLDETFSGFVVNPRAKVLGHLLWAGRAESRAIVARVVPIVVDLVDRLQPPLDVNSVECIHELGSHLDGAAGDRVLRRYETLASASVGSDEEAWSSYGVRPLDVVRDPSEPLFDRLGNLVDRHLDFEIEHQAPDGSWGPTWSWFGSHPETWPVAEKEWAGHLTVETVRTLRRFGRVAG